MWPDPAGGFAAEPPCRWSSSSPTEGASDAQMAAMKQQAPESVQGRKEFLVEVLMLTVLSQPNFVSLVGFCAQGDKRLLLHKLDGQMLIEEENTMQVLKRNTQAQICFNADGT
ncbi:probable serine/threonine-protein kinase PBL21 isoform X2 [Triticum aestivum]|uniref:probable serine/threonine-protein kinase PBL21 isoform X2 n=1 Tax=Triticum aestivum TaxID=4565 RepID=UPI001D00B6E4|nr:probable serine/threonine-protein kinase PBL21 isoform X2 [Triticum aestivum]